MHKLRSAMPAFSLVLLLSGAAGCQGGRASTDEGAQNSADITNEGCAVAFQRCISRLGLTRVLCEERRADCLASLVEAEPEPVVCEAGFERDESSNTCLRVPMIGDVALAGVRAPDVVTPYTQGDGNIVCGISAGESTCTATLVATPAVNARYAIKLSSVGPISGCTEGPLEVDVPWIQSALQVFSGGTNISIRFYSFQAFHCEGDEITDIPVSDSFSIIGACELGSDWDPATNTCA